MKPSFRPVVVHAAHLGKHWVRTFNPVQNHLLKHFSTNRYTMSGAENIEMPNTAHSLVSKTNK